MVGHNTLLSMTCTIGIYLEAGIDAHLWHENEDLFDSNIRAVQTIHVWRSLYRLPLLCHIDSRRGVEY